MITEAPPIDEGVLQHWLVTTESPDRFGTRPRTQAKFRAEPWFVTHWAWVFGGALFVFYFVAGMWMLYGANYAIGDALARGASSRSIVHSRDPHLMAVGFYWMPLPALAQVPFMAVFSRLGQPGVAIVLPTSFATALTIPILARIGRDLGVGRRLLVPLIVLFALNPYTIFSAASTMSEPWQVLSLAGCFAAYLRWTQTRRTRDIARLGFWLAVSQLSRTESLLVVLIFGGLVAWQSEKGRRAALAVAVMAPALFALIVWTITAIVIIKHPWWVQSPGDGAAGGDLIKGAFISDDRTLSAVTGFSLKLTLWFGPGILLAIAASGLMREISGVILMETVERVKLRSVAIVGIGAIFPALQAYLLLEFRTFGDPRYFMPTILIGTLLSLVALERTGRVTLKAVALFGCAIASCVSTYHVLDDPKLSHVTMEPAVIDSLLGRPWRFAGADLDDWRAYTEQIDRRLRPDDVLVLDQKNASAVFLFTDHPTRMATERDKDTEQELQLPKPRYTWAIYAPGGQGTANPAIGSMIQARRTDGKRWVQVSLPHDSSESFATLPQVWHLEDAPATPSAGPIGASGVTAAPQGAATPAPTTSVPPSATTPSIDQENDS